jgi:hypothetical protein
MLIVLLLAVGQTRSESFGGKASVSQVLIVTKWLRLVELESPFRKSATNMRTPATGAQVDGDLQLRRISECVRRKRYCVGKGTLKIRPKSYSETAREMVLISEELNSFSAG